STISGLIGDASVVAVSLSGGLDSFAVLDAVSRQASRERRLVAVVGDLVDDQGRSSAALAQSWIDRAGIDCELQIVPGNHREPIQWRPQGPCFAAHAELASAISVAAAAADATILLTGDGSDELLGAPRFLLASLPGLRSRARYARDTALASKEG